MPGLRLDEVAQLRLVAQRLAGAGASTPAEAVRWLTAVQAQDYSGALISLSLRTRARSCAEVVAALDAGQVVRSWPMRGTLHLTAAEDLPWMLRCLAARVIRSSASRRAGLGLDEPQLERARELATEALSGGRRLRRSDLLATWTTAGLDPGGQRGVHMLRYLAMTGTLVFGPTTAGEQLLVLLDGPDPGAVLHRRYPNLVEMASEHSLQPGYDVGDEFEIGLSFAEQETGPAQGPATRSATGPRFPRQPRTRHLTVYFDSAFTSSFDGSGWSETTSLEGAPSNGWTRRRVAQSGQIQ